MRYLQEVVDSGLRTDMTTRFEQRFAAEMGVKHCIATPGCTPALHLLAMALPFQPGDEVIVSPVTDYGTIMGLVKEQYIPVFADTAPGTVNVSAETIAPLITDRTRAILVVHKTGLLCDMDPIVELARAHDLVVIEDVCQAVFGRYKGRTAGTLGDAAGFSFDAEKTLGSDIGGCLHTAAGNALRMTQCTAAMTLAQLEIIHEQVAQRDRMARLLAQRLAEIPGISPLPIPAYVDVYSAWMVGFSIDPAAFRCSADEFGRQCAAAGIPGASTARYYLLPAACTFLQEKARHKVYPYSTPPASRAFRYSGDSCPRAQAFLETFIRWATFCEKYQPEHCDLAAQIVRQVADANRA
jgi:dTDP-4-amino-4,6-dideoxygalactose transaminase